MYIRGEIILVESNDEEKRGSEQSKTRPALIIQNNMGNHFSSTLIVALITTKIKKGDLPTHVMIDEKNKKNLSLYANRNVIQLEQIHTIDKSRVIKSYGVLDFETMEKVDKALSISLGIKKQKPNRYNTYAKKDLIEIYGINRNTANKLFDLECLPKVKVGSQNRIRLEDFELWIKIKEIERIRKNRYS